MDFKLRPSRRYICELAYEPWCLQGVGVARLRVSAVAANAAGEESLEGVSPSTLRAGWETEEIGKREGEEIGLHPRWALFRPKAEEQAGPWHQAPPVGCARREGGAGRV